MKYTPGVVVAFIALTLSAQALAQQETWRTTLSGQVRDVARVPAMSGSDEHLFVRIAPDGARSRDDHVLVELGSPESANQLGIERGDRVRVSGLYRPITLESRWAELGLDVLIAERITVDSRRLQETRAFTRSSPRDPFREGRQQKTRTIHGTIDSIKDMAIRGMDEDHRFAKIRDDRTRRTWIVDLGAKSELEQLDLDLQADDRVIVRGRQDRLNGRTIVRATQLAELVVLNREMQGYGAQLRGRDGRGEIR